MSRDELALLLEWHRWASQRLVEASARLRPERFIAGAGALPSVRDLLARLINLDASWLARLRGRPASFAVFTASLSAATDAERRWSPIQADLGECLLGTSSPDLNEEIAFRSRSGVPVTLTRWQVAFELLTRAATLRGEALTSLRAVTGRAIHLDFFAYLRGRLPDP